MAILSVHFLWRARTRGGGGEGSLFSLAQVAGGGHVRVNRLKPRAPLYAYTEACTVHRCVLVRIMAAYSSAV